MANNRGSEWNQWDLHFHTPSSYDYKDKSVTNEQIIETLVSNNIRCVAITDHNTIDIERIKELKSIAGDKLTIFPGIELRCELGGSESVHFICIFPEDISLSTLKTKFLGKVDLTEEDIREETHEKIYRDLADTVRVVRELGGLVTIHAGKKTNSIENLSNKISEKLAQKEDIVKNIDIYEVGQVKDIEDYREKVFPNINVIVPTIICSDNHDVKQYLRKEKLWIKAKPCFEGLKQAIKEPEERFVVADEPMKLKLVSSNPNKYIDCIEIKGKSIGDQWFNDKIELNQDLVTIIGNKGNGKSALADIIGHAGNTHNTKFSFLSSERFNQKPEYLGKNYAVNIKWKNGIQETKQLYPINNLDDIEKVKYLPQRYIEQVCNDLADGFTEEIERLIFDYLPEEEKLKKDSLKDLMKYITEDINKEILTKKMNLRVLNSEIFNKENKISENQKKLLYAQKKESIKELGQEQLNQPLEVIKPDINPEIEQRLAQYNKEIEDFTIKLEAENNRLISLNDKKHIIENSIEQIEKTIKNIVEWEKQLNRYLSDNGIEKQVKFKLEVEYEELHILKNKISHDIEEIKKYTSKYEVDGKDGILISKIKQAQNEITLIKNTLSQTEIVYQKYVENMSKWRERIKEISVRKEKIEDEIKAIENDIPKQLDELYKQRKILCENIYHLKRTIIDKYEQKYSYVQKAIEKLVIGGTEKPKKKVEKLVIGDGEKPNISINFYLDNVVLQEKLLNNINRQVKSIFRGIEEGKERLNNLMEAVNHEEFESLYIGIQSIEESLKKSTIEYDKVFKDKDLFFEELYGLEYLTNNYELKLGDKLLNKLSPGERGLLLLLFYLILDKENCPLIIDQPEDNLDNQSIFNKLVPYILRAKQHRQIIIVTHNPNIAVACDSEQVIYSNMDKEKTEVRYDSGSMEDFGIRENIVDVLEGTMPAFDKRSSKYGR